jgi:carbonic anhydrase
MSAVTRLSISALMVALLAGPALAARVPAQWEAVAASGGSTVEIDKSRISRLKGGKTAAWTRLTLDHPVLDFENQVRYTSVQALNHYDCAKGSFATQKRVFLLDGREIKSETVGVPRQIAAQSSNLDARLSEEACKPRTVGEMQQTAAYAAQQAAAAVAAGDAARPRAMHAEMVSAPDAALPRSMKVADVHAPMPAPAPPPTTEKPRMFDMPLIDKSKAEDPLKGTASAPAAAQAPAARAATPPPPLTRAAQATPKALDHGPTPDLSRQQRELMLATSGPKASSFRKKAAAPEEPSGPDFSHVHWGYAGLGAPENWAKLHPGNAACSTGKRQSPIDIRGGIKVDLEPIRFDYRNTEFRIIDNGHSVQVDVGEGNSITVMGRTYPLVHFHFHRPSEERVNGKTYDMVAHLVHKDYDNSLAVIAVLMEKGMEHPVIQTLWNYMPLEVGMESAPPNVTIDLSKLLPQSREYYTYMGSLTTPPCTENVLWMVFKSPVQVSPEQIGIFARLYPNNARPVQPVNDRLIKGSR